MTKQGSFKRVVRRRAQESGQRYTAALAEFEGDGLEARIWHRADPDRLVDHLREHYGGGIVAATPCGAHTQCVFRVERRDGPAWLARVHSPQRPLGRVEGDAAVLAFLEHHGYPAERLATSDAVSELDGQGVIVTEFIPGGLPAGDDTDARHADLLGRLHALPLDETVTREGGAFAHDPAREGRVVQDLAAAMSFLNAADGLVAVQHREWFEELRKRVRTNDDADGLPDALTHSDLTPWSDHVIAGSDGLHAIHWQASGRGSRAAEFAWLVHTTNADQAVMSAYGAHVELTTEELDRLAELILIRPLYLKCWYYWRSVAGGTQPTGSERWWGWADADEAASLAAAARQV